MWFLQVQQGSLRFRAAVEWLIEGPTTRLSRKPTFQLCHLDWQCLSSSHPETLHNLFVLIPGRGVKQRTPFAVLHQGFFF
jgi:hypothetical protein